MAADFLPSKKGMEHLVDEGVATGEMEVMLEVGRFDVDGCAEVRLVNKDNTFLTDLVYT